MNRFYLVAVSLLLLCFTVISQTTDTVTELTATQSIEAEEIAEPVHEIDTLKEVDPVSTQNEVEIATEEVVLFEDIDDEPAITYTDSSAQDSNEPASSSPKTENNTITKSNESVKISYSPKYMRTLNDIDRQYLSTSIIFSIGTWYSAVGGMVYSQKAWTHYYYNEKGNYDDFARIAIGPAASVFTSFGAVNLVQIHKASKMLSTEMGEPVPKVKNAGLILYFASIATTALNLTSSIADNKTFTATTSLLNAGVLISSYAVNSIAYTIIRKRIIRAGEKKYPTKKSVKREGVKLLPYIYATDKSSGAGLTLKL